MLIIINMGNHLFFILTNYTVVTYPVATTLRFCSVFDTTDTLTLDPAYFGKNVTMNHYRKRMYKVLYKTDFYVNFCDEQGSVTCSYEITLVEDHTLLSITAQLVAFVLLFLYSGSR